MSRADRSKGIALRIVRKAPERTTFRNTFMIEAMLLLLCVMVLVAVVMAILGSSYVKGQEASDLNRAITIAANAAERFEARGGASECWRAPSCSYLRSPP